MGAWHGPQPRGAARELRRQKRREAEERNAKTPLVEEIKAPMTKVEAQILSQRLNDPDRPKRKLPPRP